MHRRNPHQQTRAFHTKTIEETTHKRCVPQSRSFCRTSSVSHSPLLPSAPPAAVPDLPLCSATKNFHNKLPTSLSQLLYSQEPGSASYAVPGQVPNAQATSQMLLIHVYSCFRAFPCKGCSAEATVLTTPLGLWGLEQSSLWVNPVAITGWIFQLGREQQLWWTLPETCSYCSGLFFNFTAGIRSLGLLFPPNPGVGPSDVSHGLCSQYSASLHEVSKIISCTKLCKNL